MNCKITLQRLSTFALSTVLISSTLFAKPSQTEPPIEGMIIGPNYIAWEAEATNSPLDKWELITPDNAKYHDEGKVAPIGKTHLEFTGNNEGSGPATSPLEYKFTCPKTGKYRLGARLYQRLNGSPEDKCNDVYIKMDGDFTSANGVKTEYLKHNQKFYGRGVDKWGALFNLEIHETEAHSAAEYNLIEGQEYTLTVSGRAQRTNIDYWLLYETTLPIIMEAHKDIAEVNPEEFRPPSITCKTFMAVDMKYTGIEGFTDAQTDKKEGMEILQIADRLAWAAAQLIYDGTDGKATFTLNTLQETDGESSYRVKINNRLIGEVTNGRIHGTDIPDYTIQSHSMNDSAVALNDGDTIQIEFSNATNGLVPEGDLTATSRGRWLSLDICTSGRYRNYDLTLSKESVSLAIGKSTQLDVEINLPEGTDSTLIWSTADTTIAIVKNGLVSGITAGSTELFVSAANGEYTASCKVIVFAPGPFHGKAIRIPGIIQVEDYDYGIEGESYHDSNPANEGNQYRLDDGVDIETCTKGGFDIGWTEAGEWLKYSIDVTEEGNYNLEMSIASMTSGGKYHIKIDDNDVTGAQTFSKTGGWQTWETTTVKNIALTTGSHTLTLGIDAGGWNVDWIRLDTSTMATNTTDIYTIKGDESMVCYPNPMTDNLNIISSNTNVKVYLLNTIGQVVMENLPVNENINTSALSKGVYIVQLTDNNGTLHSKKIIKQ